MKKQFLEAGKIVNTVGIRGEVKIQPWTSTPDFLCSFKRLFIDGKPVNIISARPHKNCVIAVLDGVSDLESAIKLKNKVVMIDRDDAVLDENEYFIEDLIGLKAIDFNTEKELGTISEIISLPSNDVYVISGEREILVPVVPEFIREVNTGKGFIRVRLIEGM